MEAMPDRHRLQSLPKIELHRHLEGALRLTTLLDIAAEYDLPLPRTAEVLAPLVQVVPGEPRTWELFLSKFRVLRQFFRSEDIVRRVTREAVADAAADGVRYLELRFTPVALANAIGCPFADVLAWVCAEAMAEAELRGIDVRLIVSINRHEGVPLGGAVFDAAFDFIGQGVVAVDLAGREPEVEVEPFRGLFARARARGLGLTIHAGEWRGPDAVSEALAVFEPERIGHGVRAAEDPALLQRLARRGTVLELCPSSNVDSGVVQALNEHPLPALIRAGVRVTLNTDDPGISAITLTEEITRVLAALPLTLDDIKRMTVTAAESAFLPDAARRELAAAIQSRLLD